MAPGSAASALLVEAYVGRSASCDRPARPAPRVRHATVRFVEPPRGNTLEQIISGSWAPPNMLTQPEHIRDLTHPGRGSAFGQLARWRIKSPRLPDSSPSRGKKPSRVPSHPVEKAVKDFARVAKDLERLKRIRIQAEVEALQKRQEEGWQQTQKDAPARKCLSARESAASVGRRRSVVTHATTPSWRSVASSARSATASEHGEAEEGRRSASKGRRRRRESEGRTSGHEQLEEKWAEVQYAPVPRSELRHLDAIASSVNEANAVLVESFLNVKRRTPSYRAESSYRGSEVDERTERSSRCQ